MNRIGLMILCLLAAGCNTSRPPASASQPRTVDTAATTQPATGTSASTEPDWAASRSAPASRPASAPTTATRPASAASAEPKLPDYITIVQREQSDATARVDFELSGTDRLTLSTANVKRLRITRENSPLEKRRSVAIRIDGRGIEWTPKRQTLLLEHTPTGDWVAVDESKP